MRGTFCVCYCNRERQEYVAAPRAIEYGQAGWEKLLNCRGYRVISHGGGERQNVDRPRAR